MEGKGLGDKVTCVTSGRHEGRHEGRAVPGKESRGPPCPDYNVAFEQPFDCAGAIKSEGRGIALLDSIETQDPTALIGLPLIRLAAFLRTEGVSLWPAGGVEPS